MLYFPICQLASQKVSGVKILLDMEASSPMEPREEKGGKRGGDIP